MKKLYVITKEDITLEAIKELSDCLSITDILSSSENLAELMITEDFAPITWKEVQRLGVGSFPINNVETIHFILKL